MWSGAGWSFQQTSVRGSRSPLNELPHPPQDAVTRMDSSTTASDHPYTSFKGINTAVPAINIRAWAERLLPDCTATGRFFCTRDYASPPRGSAPAIPCVRRSLPTCLLCGVSTLNMEVSPAGPKKSSHVPSPEFGTYAAAKRGELFEPETAFFLGVSLGNITGLSASASILENGRCHAEELDRLLSELHGDLQLRDYISRLEGVLERPGISVIAKNKLNLTLALYHFQRGCTDKGVKALESMTEPDSKDADFFTMIQAHRKQLLLNLATNKPLGSLEQDVQRLSPIVGQDEALRAVVMDNLPLMDLFPRRADEIWARCNTNRAETACDAEFPIRFIFQLHRLQQNFRCNILSAEEAIYEAQRLSFDVHSLHLDLFLLDVCLTASEDSWSKASPLCCTPVGKAFCAIQAALLRNDNQRGTQHQARKLLKLKGLKLQELAVLMCLYSEQVFSALRVRESFDAYASWVDWERCWWKSSSDKLYRHLVDTCIGHYAERIIYARVQSQWEREWARVPQGLQDHVNGRLPQGRKLGEWKEGLNPTEEDSFDAGLDTDEDEDEDDKAEASTPISWNKFLD